jgi:hypothetical protein
LFSAVNRFVAVVDDDDAIDSFKSKFLIAVFINGITPLIPTEEENITF